MTKKGRIQKKPYSNPKITKVDLRSEEAVLTACKEAVNYTPLTSSAAGGCKYHGSVCNVQGS